MNNEQLHAGQKNRTELNELDQQIKRVKFLVEESALKTEVLRITITLNNSGDKQIKGSSVDPSFLKAFLIMVSADLADRKVALEAEFEAM